MGRFEQWNARPTLISPLNYRNVGVYPYASRSASHEVFLMYAWLPQNLGIKSLRFF